jgi:benzoyl-CoA reductase/2-hydroxyglutaryl-CoA dehydratase subunit BcrC/BadD/HgdB
MTDSVTAARKAGTPFIFVQGGQSVDPYYGAGGIALRPASTGLWSRGRFEGLSLREEQIRSMDEREKARRALSVEICNTAGYESIQEGNLPVDMVAPHLCLRCSDVSYGLEAHRHGKHKVDLFLVDYPLDHQKDKDWAVDYLSKTIHRLTDKIGKLANKEVTEQALNDEIKLHNRGRKLAIEVADVWWSAKVPPTNGVDRRNTFQMGGMELHGDPNASLTVLKETTGYIKDRVKHGVKGEGIADDAKRIFVLGSCVFPNDFRTEEAGGIIVGNDNHWSDINTLVEENGDPYENMAKAILSYPYEQPIEERAKWTIEQLQKSRTDGVLFLYNWGCNTQSAIARMLCDIIKEETGIPTLIIENEMRGDQTEQLQNRVNAFIEMLN